MAGVVKMIKTIDLEVPSHHDTAGRIASEASRLFAIKGFGGVSIKEISEAAGVTSASIHYHFGTKANLFQQIIEQFISKLLVSARLSLVIPRNPEDLKIRLEIFIRRTVDAIIERPDVLSIIRREMDRSKDVTASIPSALTMACRGVDCHPTCPTSQSVDTLQGSRRRSVILGGGVS
jgi:AcrR family transcriptional regulator